MISANEFWEWFQANSAVSLKQHNGITTELEEQYFDRLQEKLHEYDEHLYFEIGGSPDVPNELIITAEGDIDYFEKVEELIAAAPEIESWEFIALIPPRELAFTSQFEDVVLNPSEIWFLPLDNKNQPAQIGLRICLPNYEDVKNSKWLKAAVYKMLDTVLGERAFALDVHYIDFAALPAEPEKHGMIELHEMPAFIRWKKKKLATG